MLHCLSELKIKLGLTTAPQPAKRKIPLGPIGKKHFKDSGYTLIQLYGDNEVKTSRYTWYNFIFKNLNEQAQRVANFYFICIVILQAFTDSPVTPFVSILPLAFVITLTLIKQGYEDWLRHKADREINYTPVQIITENGDLTVIPAKSIQLGDIVLCRANDTFPCDMVLLSSSEYSGECFATTSSLDGETNLKKFLSPAETMDYETPSSIISNLSGLIVCQQPIADLYKFIGRIEVSKPGHPIPITMPIATENLLLRGARLRNTDYIYGCAVYTGQDTKMAMNSKGKQTKFSQVERKLNAFLVIILIFLICISLLYTILKNASANNYIWYINSIPNTAWLIVQDFLGFIVLFNYIIPISLYVTIEVQKFVGSMFFVWDKELYDEKLNQPAVANTSDIIEEMGQVSIIKITRY
ncbi:unnamed protein product [Protopolystoma xenopodis]|uniref:Uncharacterized protein n=1 Tax=Protopolystoma xenopodis TaxID=117903 RepID=A0A448W9S2_9PLAT|nr:unnamed protein product [Protopolystoma xenopodis]